MADNKEPNNKKFPLQIKEYEIDPKVDNPHCDFILILPEKLKGQFPGYSESDTDLAQHPDADVLDKIVDKNQDTSIRRSLEKRYPDINKRITAAKDWKDFLVQFKNTGKVYWNEYTTAKVIYCRELLHNSKREGHRTHIEGKINDLKGYIEKLERHHNPNQNKDNQDQPTEEDNNGGKVKAEGKSIDFDKENNKVSINGEDFINLTDSQYFIVNYLYKNGKKKDYFVIKKLKNDINDPPDPKKDRIYRYFKDRKREDLFDKHIETEDSTSWLIDSEGNQIKK